MFENYEKARVCNDWPMIFAAGPGSGKSTCAIKHVDWLVSQGYRVLVVSFTRAAVNSLRKHFLGVENVWLGTIDSFYYQCLRVFDRLEGFNGRNFSLLGTRFGELLDDKEFVDFLNDSIDAIVVDEGQDTSRQQIVNLWRVSENLHVFMDIDQCIYEWRGAMPETVRNFSRWNQIEPITLDYTFRLTKPVLAASSLLISHNSRRFSFALRTDKPGPPIQYEETPFDVECTLKRVKELGEADTAVLCRNLKGRYFMQSFWDMGFQKSAQSHKPYAGTIHGAKGLEWKNVFIIRANCNEYSHSSLEEERRIFYTAMTRSAWFLHISAYSPICFVSEALGED